MLRKKKEAISTNASHAAVSPAISRATLPLVAGPFIVDGGRRGAHARPLNEDVDRLIDECGAETVEGSHRERSGLEANNPCVLLDRRRDNHGRSYARDSVAIRHGHKPAQVLRDGLQLHVDGPCRRQSRDPLMADPRKEAPVSDHGLGRFHHTSRRHVTRCGPIDGP